MCISKLFSDWIDLINRRVRRQKRQVIELAIYLAMSPQQSTLGTRLL